MRRYLYVCNSHLCLGTRSRFVFCIQHSCSRLNETQVALLRCLFDPVIWQHTDIQCYLTRNSLTKADLRWLQDTTHKLCHILISQLEMCISKTSWERVTFCCALSEVGQGHSSASRRRVMLRVVQGWGGAHDNHNNKNDDGTQSDSI